MSGSTNTYQTYTQVGAREDLEDIVYNISPMDTIAFTRLSKSKATNTLH